MKFGNFVETVGKKKTASEYQDATVQFNSLDCSLL